MTIKINGKKLATHQFPDGARGVNVSDIPADNNIDYDDEEE